MVTPAMRQTGGSYASRYSLRMSELGRALSTTPHNVTKLVDGLAADGHVERRAVPDDRRSTALHLTAQGRTLQRRLGDAHAEAIAEAFTALDDPELKQIAAALDRLRAELARRSGGR